MDVITYKGLVKPVAKTEVTNSYQGQQGCACGCRGEYAKTGPAVTRRVNIINQHLAEVEVMDFGGMVCIEYVADNDRVTRVYTGDA